MIGFDLGEMCIEAMSKLAERPVPHFGLTGRDDDDLEKAFQLAFTDELGAIVRARNINVSWKREIAYRTRALTNTRDMIIDIGGVFEGELAVAIELKYVTSRYRNNSIIPPSDRLAFSYDVAKDCLKLELLVDRAHEGEFCSPNKHAPKEVSRKLQTCIIALTNWPEFWAGRRPVNGWSKHFARRLHGYPHYRPMGSVEISNDPGSVPRIEVATKNLINAIYYCGTKRPHISFGLTWKGQWRSYATVDDAGPHGELRYLLLKPVDEAIRPNWGVEIHDTLPFRNTSRDTYDQIACAWKVVRDEFSRMYPREDIADALFNGKHITPERTCSLMADNQHITQAQEEIARMRLKSASLHKLFFGSARFSTLPFTSSTRARRAHHWPGRSVTAENQTSSSSTAGRECRQRGRFTRY